ncbi:hypothetical protein ACPYO6_08520 [Georgenia sp. Z1344]|uniref:hypothetical protein n=1 Tax=Georgenia sp. Z1344 TaxID=3416706 RepID=UPI003CE9A85E
MSLRPRPAVAVAAGLLALGLASCADDAPVGPAGTAGEEVPVETPDADDADGVTRSTAADGLSLTVELDTTGAAADPAQPSLEAVYEVTNTGAADMLLVRGIGTANPTAEDLASDPAAIPSAVEVEGGVAWLTSRAAPQTVVPLNARGIVLAPGETYVGRAFAPLPLELADGSRTPSSWGVCIEHGTAADGGATTSGSGPDLGTAPNHDGSGEHPLVLLDIEPLPGITADPTPITVLCSATAQILPAHALADDA